MEDNYSLEGKLVTIFLRGSWEFTGRVEFASKDKVVLASDMGSLVVYKENIVAAMIIDEKKEKEITEVEPATQYDMPIATRNSRPASLRIPYEPEGQDQYYGSVIPEDMLEGDSATPPVSFTMSMQELRTAKPEEVNNDPTEKTPIRRRKDKEGL